MKSFFILLALCLPGAALACDQIGSRFQYCFDDSPWAQAELQQFGDGATYVLGDITLDQQEPYPGRSDGPIEEDLAAYNSFFGDESDQILSVEPFEMPGKTGVIQMLQSGMDQRLIAQAFVIEDGARVMLWVTAPEGSDAAETRALLGDALSALSLM